jgi:speckle-type POZ protein
VRGTHTFTITGYSLHRGLGVGKFLKSPSFDVGGHLWCICYFPDGMVRRNGDYASVYVGLANELVEGSASVEVRLLDQANKLPPSVVLSKKRRCFSLACVGQFLQPSAYLQDDNLVIECEITVFKEPEVTPTATTIDIPVPPSDLAEYFRELLDKGEEADVVFEVNGEAFPAHKIVVSARSQ